MHQFAVSIILLILQTSIKGNYICPQSQPCFYECTETSPCSANPYTIQCRTSSPCTIHCTGSNVCSHTVINCPMNANCTVQCNGVNACTNAIINASANIVAFDVICDDQNACFGTTIYWPSDETISRSLSCDAVDNSCNGINHYNSATTKPTTSIPSELPTISPTTSYSTTGSSITSTVTTSLPTKTPTTIPTSYPTTTIPTFDPTTLSPTTYPTITGTLKSKVAISIRFDYTYNNTDNIVHVKQLLVNTTTSIINEGIIALNIDCYSSDYIINVDIFNLNTAKINATILLCNVTEGDELADYFQNMLGKNNVIETKYEENNDIINLIADTSTIVAISNDIIKPITSTTTSTEKPETTSLFELKHEDDDNEGDTIFIIIFGITSFVLCLCVTMLIIVYISRRNRKKNSKNSFEMPCEPEPIPSAPNSPSTTIQQSTDINTKNGEDHVTHNHDEDDDDDNIDDMYKIPEPGSPSSVTHGFIGGVTDNDQAKNVEMKELNLNTTQ